MKREPFFECVFASEGSEYRFHFRAWSAEEAVQHLREELRSAGVTEQGELRVLDARGEVLHRKAFNPVRSRSQQRGMTADS